MKSLERNILPRYYFSEDARGILTHLESDGMISEEQKFKFIMLNERTSLGESR